MSNDSWTCPVNVQILSNKPVNIGQSLDNIEKLVDIVDTTVDNVKILASIGIVLASLGKDALILMLLVGLGLLVYWAYRRWVQNKS